MATTEQDAPRVGEYVDAGGVHTYYEVAGTGEPLILLHGGFCTVETFGAQTPALAEQYQIYVPERRGHGRTPDVEGPITYENMAQDTIAFMEALGISSAHLVGWSDGAVVGLLVALQRPDLARKLVLIGQAMNQDGVSPEGKSQLSNMTQQDIPPMLRELYDSASPDGADHFGVVFDKLHQLLMTEPNIELTELERLSIPTLVLVADDDIGSTVEYAATMQRALPHSQLAVVPGTSHASLMEKPELVNRLILDFLAPEQVTKLFG